MELIKIYKGNLVNARELQAFLEVKSDFSTWIKRMIGYGLEESKDYFTLHKKVERQVLKEYLLTLSAAKEICMIQRNEKGKLARKYFIECEEKLAKISQDKRFAAFNKLEATKNKFKATLRSIDLGEEDFVEIDTAGRKVFFNGNPIPDEQLQTLLISARDLATNMTHYHTLQQELQGADDIKKSNEGNHAALREALLQKGISPESLPPQEDVKKLED